MKTLLLIGIFVFAIVVILGMALGVSFLAYWLVYWAGAPKWVAVLTGVAVFFISGWVANLSNKRDVR